MFIESHSLQIMMLLDTIIYLCWKKEHVLNFYLHWHLFSVSVLKLLSTSDSRSVKSLSFIKITFLLRPMVTPYFGIKFFSAFLLHYFQLSRVRFQNRPIGFSPKSKNSVLIKFLCVPQLFNFFDTTELLYIIILVEAVYAIIF